MEEMTKAQKAALKAFPGKSFMHERTVYEFGYERAEHELSLTWKDIIKLQEIEQRYSGESNRPVYGTKEFAEEVLRKFNETRK